MTLKTTNLTKKFGDVPAVENISLTVEEGNIFALIGPNGSGKTTLTKLIAGLLQPTNGTAHINGIDITEKPVAAKQVFGYIPDNPTIWSHMTGIEFLHFTGALYGIDQETRTQRINDLLPTFSLRGIEDTAFGHYSRGNRQKFTILASLLHDPDLLLIDEPIVGLDPDSVTILESLLKEFTNDGGAVFMTTHTLPVAERIADTIGLLTKGRIKAAGSQDNLRKGANLPEDTGLHEIYSHFANTKK